MPWTLDGLAGLHTALTDAGYTVVGPTVRDQAIVLAELASADDLPYGWGVTLEPGGYRVRRREDDAAFAHSAGPQSWKPFLHPPRGSCGRHAGLARAPRWRGSRGSVALCLLGRTCHRHPGPCADRRRAPRRGVRRPPHRRTGAFIISVNCTEPGETCFCTSMGTATSGRRL